MASKRTATSSSEQNRVLAPMGEVRCIDVKDIDLFDRNPRRYRNPAYDRIKNSILARGLDQPLIVTRRPNEKRYVVHAGGNTRLQILKELTESSKDPLFSMVNCIFVDWNCESSVLLAHLRENDLRGDLTFIDKATAIAAAEELLAEESGSTKLTARELRQKLAEQGFSLSISLLSYMNYAVNALMPSMPVALSEGLGRPQIEIIRRLHRAARDIWTERNIGSGQEFDGVFAELCRRSDSPDWIIDPLKQAVEIEIAEAADLSVQIVRLEIEYRMSGNRSGEYSPFLCAVDVNDDENNDTGSADFECDRRLGEIETHTENGTVSDQQKCVDESETAVNLTIRFDTPVEAARSSRSSTRTTPIYSQLGFLRQTIYQLADGLAHRYGIAHLIAPTPAVGAGYIVTNLPTGGDLEVADDEARMGVTTMWWQLMSFSETSSAPLNVLDSHSASHSELRSILEADSLNTLLPRVESIEPGQYAKCFWSQLSEQDWQDWVLLAKTYRELRANILQNELTFWERSS